ncbi:MAG: hypothetical protein GC199_10920 [Alphaproteobacteria bacterium]|nr:hypothetical protein [Alphaproteobacteria bacterium]
MDLSLVLDIALVALLMALIAYCAILDRRLRAVRAGQGELEGFLADLTEATARAEQSIITLRAKSGDKVSELQENVKSARALSDELSLLVETGSRLAERLETARPGVDDPAAPLRQILREVR